MGFLTALGLICDFFHGWRLLNLHSETATICLNPCGKKKQVVTLHRRINTLN